MRWALSLAALLLAAGCSASPPAAGPPAAPPPAPADGFDVGRFTLGVLADLSGPAADADRAALAGVQAYWAGVNARGGVAGLYPVELSVSDHDAAGSEAGAAAAVLEGWDIAALAYLSPAIDAAELTGELPVPAVPAVATLAGEDLGWVLTWTSPVELTTVGLLDRFRASGPGATWCIIVDRSPPGRQVAAAAYAAGAARETVPAVLDLEVGEIEVLDLDASVFDVTDAVEDRRCRHVLVEAAEPTAIHVLDRLPANLTVVRRSTLAAGRELPEGVELLIDAAPPWSAGGSEVMDAFAADWTKFNAEAPADARARAGWLSQLRLHLLLEQAVAAGDVSRERLVALAPRVEPVDPNRNTLPGVPRVGMDISEPVAGGPVRTLRLYGRSEVGADRLGLRQVLVLDLTSFAEGLRERLGASDPFDS
ncbi:ABC transporter substrate-binding protein [Candidatus Poriferisodalis sp.]|uniref:ABC transporter substrate-binding protein n=1 Tax=Candidatus Poriferisodalis sp. TaxID=3101277 RepID=UPI003B0169C5